MIALVFVSFWSCSAGCVSLCLFLSLASLLFILLLTFLLTLKAEVNTWKDWWPFNENVSIPVVGGEAGTVSMTLELSPAQLHVPWQLLNVSFSLLRVVKSIFSDVDHFFFLKFRKYQYPSYSFFFALLTEVKEMPDRTQHGHVQYLLQMRRINVGTV